MYMLVCIACRYACRYACMKFVYACMYAGCVGAGSLLGGDPL